MKMQKENMIRLCEGQLEAYNQRDLFKFISFYHPEVRVQQIQNSEPDLIGIAEFTSRYKKVFDENPELHCDLRSRMALETSVLDEEWVTGVKTRNGPSHVVAIYKFKDNLIHSVWFAR